MRNDTFSTRISKCTYQSLEPFTNELKGFGDMINPNEINGIWEYTARSYIQNLGLTNLNLTRDEFDFFLSGIKMYTTEMPSFIIQPPTSFMTREELMGGDITTYSFTCDIKNFTSEQNLINFLVSQLLENKEIFIHSMHPYLVVDPTNFYDKKIWMLKFKTVDWSVILNRTDFSAIKFKKDFTPTKKIPKFDM